MTSSNSRVCPFRRIDATGLLKLSEPFVLVAVLLTPSIWMITVIPPLWRDIDAYGEVTQFPGTGTFLLYGPLYCFAARVPLYFGYAIDCLREGSPLPTFRFFGQPILSDAGVFALLVTQHAGLCCSAFYLISSTTRLFWSRLLLAIAWMLNPLFYTLAHTIGSEALSMIVLLLMGATGLRIVQSSRNVSRWFLFGILLYLSILTRHVNAVLAALMPAAFLTYGFIVAPFTASSACGRDRLVTTKRAFQQAAVAVAVGLSCIVLANASVGVLCHAARIPYYSTLGLSFLYRLKFLATLRPEERNQLLDQAAKHTSSPDVRNLISLLRVSFPARTSNWDVKAFNQKASALLFPGETDPSGVRYAVLLNHTAITFLYPPNEIFLRRVAMDLNRSQQITIPDVVSFLFVTTRFYFSHREAMPQCASLVTFRGKNAEQIFAIFKRHSYFRHPKNVSYHAFLVIWIVLLAAFLLTAKMRERDVTGIASYASALIVIAILMMLANCLLAVFQPRYTLPMWELTIVSLCILFGGMMDALLHQSGPLHSPELNDQAKHSDHVQSS